MTYHHPAVLLIGIPADNAVVGFRLPKSDEMKPGDKYILDDLESWNIIEVFSTNPSAAKGHHVMMCRVGRVTKPTSE